MTVSLTVDAGLLQDALAPVSAIVDECKVDIDDDGLGVRAVDPANVGMVDMDLDASACASFSADEQTLGIDLDRLEEVIGMADADDMVELDLNEERRTLHIKIGGLEFSMGLLDPDSIRAEPDIPDLDLPATYAIEGRGLDRAISAAALCSDHLKISGVDGDTLRFAASGDTDDVEVTLNEEILSGQFSAAQSPVMSLFSLDYLSDMAAPIGSGQAVSLLLGDEMPVKLKYSLWDGDISVLFMAAPRIESGGSA